MDRSKRRSVPQVMPAPVLWTPYCGAAPAPGEWIARWNLDPVLLAAFVFGIAFYFLRSRQPENRQRYFGIGIAVLAFLFISPFCALTSALFSARTEIGRASCRERVCQYV